MKKDNPRSIIDPTTFSAANAESTGPVDTKKVHWGYTHHIFFSAHSIKKLKEKAQKKESLEIEVRLTIYFRKSI